MLIGGLNTLAALALASAHVQGLTQGHAADIAPDCTYNGQVLQGRVKVVTSFPDIRVQIVSSFPDLRVQWVDSFPDRCGRWREVDSFPDFTIQYVTSFPDLRVQAVESFPGLR
ncbi:hypothetical protein L2D00_11595 [Hyphomonadaceae bacterium BL14]|nr:hypothetical protein L2D00_11595 [Hyphomonadaceae bacterium BL14]